MQSNQRDWHLDSQSRTVLRLLAHGLHVGEIALELHVPVRRVYSIRRRLRRRFGAVTNEHLISRAVSEGFTYLKD